mmetsp:Transcript_19082/g.48617  ORF Transcript_19082/g.48617 Transcript_19082/m.48617 type:complete len:88 (-) Transcript_19082:131-394(-)
MTPSLTGGVAAVTRALTSSHLSVAEVNQRVTTTTSKISRFGGESQASLLHQVTEAPICISARLERPASIMSLLNLASWCTRLPSSVQ